MKYNYILFSLLFILTRLVYAQVPAFDDLKAEFLKLRNRDTEIQQVAEWQGLALRLKALATNYPKDNSTPAALYDSALIYELLYKKNHSEAELQESLNLYKELSKKYPKASLADDALLKAADLLAVEMNDRKAANLLYQDIVKRYPSGDMYQVAKMRLSGAGVGAGLSSKSSRKEQNSKAADLLRGPKIVLDPGHGGEDFGAVGVGGLLEKDVTLAVALQLEALLKQRLGARVQLTRRSDIFIPLSERTAMANQLEADLFVSLHTNASVKKNLTGFETFYLDNSGDEGSRKLADRENKSAQLGGAADDVSFMLSDLVENAKLEDSIMLGRNIQNAIGSELSASWGDVQSLGVRKGPFYVLVGAFMPCVLVEMFFIDNPIDGKRLGNEKFRGELAEALYKGIAEYVKKRSL